MARGCQTVSKLKTSRLSYLDNLVNEIRTGGYKTQNELAEGDRDNNRDGRATKADLLVNEIGCHIDRNGELLINSGYHRLAIAKILQLEKIPIQIIVTHKKWQEIRKKFVQSKNIKDTQDVLSAENHPDLKKL